MSGGPAPGPKPPPAPGAPRAGAVKPAGAPATGAAGDGARLRAAALAAALAIALGLRLWKIGHGLPDFLDEALPFRWALAMWDDPAGRIDWNPHLFHHPSLATYLHLFVQFAHYGLGRVLGRYHGPADFHLAFLVDPTPMALAARSVGVLADLATVVLVARIGERLRSGAGSLAALLTACSPTLIVAARSICSDTVMATLAIAAVERMLAYRERGGTGRLVAAAALAGLTASAKYPAAALLAPLALALWLRGGARALRLWPPAAAIAAAAFLVTTPFAALDFATFRRDLGFVRGLAQEGHLGNLAESGFLFHLRNLARDLSWADVALLPVSLAWTARRLRARQGEAILWLALLAFGLPIALARVEAERYLVAVLPLAALLASDMALAAAGRLPARARAAGLAAAALVLAVPALAAGLRAAAAGGDETRIEARRWIESHLGTGDLVVQETYGAPLLRHMEWLTVRSGPMYRAASAEWRRRYDARRWRASVTLPLEVVGSPTNRVQPRSRPAVEIRVAPHVADLNQAAYDPRLFQGVDWFVTSSAVRGRFAADPLRYAAENRFYALLDSAAEDVARLRPRGAGGGPEIRFYRLGPRAQRALAASGPLDPLWWAETIPAAYREEAERLLEPAEPGAAGARLAPERAGSPPGATAVRRADGSPAAWVTSLRPIYRFQFSEFAVAMGAELAERGRLAEARRFAEATLLMTADDIQACVLHALCSERLGEWDAAERVTVRTLAVLDAEGDTSPTLRLQLAEILAHRGDRAGARRELETVAAAGGEIAAEARRRLETLR